MKRLLAAILMTCAIGTGQSAADAAPVTVFAAASLAGVLETAGQGFDGHVTYSFGGSGVMARQVASGAPADVIILANPDWMTWLRDQPGVDIRADAIVAKNALVVIGPAGEPPLTPDRLKQRLGDGRLAMGHRDAVPAGVYAQAWMRNAGLWDALSLQLAETDNVRAALALVARGDTPLGVVYATDALAEPRVDVLYKVPSASHPAILYPAGALTKAGTDFLTHLATDAAAAAFVAYGFRPGTQ